MRKAGLLMALALSLMTLTGCARYTIKYPEESESVVTDAERFKPVYIYDQEVLDYSIMADKQTEVLYLVVLSSNGNVEMTVMMNPDGTPMTLDDYKEVE